jgi:DNA-binding PadR family transcriptional regulator
VAERALTDFEQILLGLLTLNEPCSGYDLKKLFTATPAAVYQPSAGALYPALRRLEQRGLLRLEAAVSAGRRGRTLYHPTGAGRAVHAEWVRQPVRPQTVARDLPLHLMRFVFMEGRAPAAAVLVFLTGLRDALEDFVKGMEQFVADAGPHMPGQHPLLALRHGIAVHQASLDWVRSALTTLSSPADLHTPCALPCGYSAIVWIGCRCRAEEDMRDDDCFRTVAWG